MSDSTIKSMNPLPALYIFIYKDLKKFLWVQRVISNFVRIPKQSLNKTVFTKSS